MEVRQMSLLFPRSSFLSFLKSEVTLILFQSSGTSPVSHDLSTMMEIGLAMTSAKCQRKAGMKYQVKKYLSL